MKLRGFLSALVALCAPSSGAVFVFSERVPWWRVVAGCALVSVTALVFVLVLVAAVRTLATPRRPPERARTAARLLADAEARPGRPPREVVQVLLRAVAAELGPTAPRLASLLAGACNDPSLEVMRATVLAAQIDLLSVGDASSPEAVLVDRLLGLLMRPTPRGAR